jgi:transcriptional antiterminator NusG
MVRESPSEARPRSSSPLYAVSVVARQEYNIAVLLKARVESSNIPVYSIVVPPSSLGVLFVEGESLPAVTRAIYGTRHVKGLLKGVTNVEEVVRLLKPAKPAVEVGIGDEIEITADILKGSRGRVIYVDREKGIVRVELLDTAFPMPLDLRISEVRLVRRASQGAGSGA